MIMQVKLQVGSDYLTISAKCSKCNTFQVISDLVHDFMNFNALNVFKNS